jgi:hypothetical protein
LKKNPFADQIKRGTGREKKQIKDLTKQVKALEDLLAKRQPNSVAAIVHAAKPSLEESIIVQELRRENADLSSQLQDKTREVGRKMRSLRQEHDQLKLMYKSRVEKLKMQLEEAKAVKAAVSRKKGAHPKVKELEKQITDLRKYYVNKLNAKKENVAAVSKASTGRQRPSSSSNRDRALSNKSTVSQARFDDIRRQLTAKTAMAKAKEKRIVDLEGILSEVETQFSALKANYSLLKKKKKTMPSPSLKSPRHTPGKTYETSSSNYKETPQRHKEPTPHPHPNDIKRPASARHAQHLNPAAQSMSAAVSRHEAATAKLHVQDAHQRELRRLQLTHQTGLEAVTGPLENSIKRLENQLTDAKEDATRAENRNQKLVDNLEGTLATMKEKMQRLEAANVEYSYEMNAKLATPQAQQYQHLLDKIRQMEQRQKERVSSFNKASLEAQNGAEMERFHWQQKYDSMLKSKNAQIAQIQGKLHQLILAMRQLQEDY